MSRTWGHQIRRLADHVVDRADRFGHTCATGKCQGLPIHAVQWNYITGRGGRASYTTRHVCDDHGAKFAAKHNLTIGDPEPERQHPVATAMQAMTSVPGFEPRRRVRVHRTAAGQWYLEQHATGAGMFSHGSRWMAGAPTRAPMNQAIAEAELLLAQLTLVPVGEWTLGAAEATVETAPAYHVEPWASRRWLMRVACNDRGMWQLHQVLDTRFPPIVTDLGNHNMTLDRAIGAAGEHITNCGWFLDDAWIVTDDVAEQTGLHPDQARSVS